MNLKLVIDTDGCTDDARALIIALNGVRRGSIELLAITCVFGTTGVQQTAANVSRIRRLTRTHQASRFIRPQLQVGSRYFVYMQVKHACRFQSIWERMGHCCASDPVSSRRHSFLDWTEWAMYPMLILHFQTPIIRLLSPTSTHQWH